MAGNIQDIAQPIIVSAQVGTNAPGSAAIGTGVRGTVELGNPAGTFVAAIVALALLRVMWESGSND